jgi:hypothetical protein
MTVQSAAPNAAGESNGHLWLDVDTGQLYMYYNGSWQSIGQPAGSTRFLARTRYDTSNNVHNTLEMIVGGQIVSITSSDATSWVPQTAGNTAEYLEDGVTLLNTQFPSIVQGINLNNGTDYLFNGTAVRAQYADLAERYHADAQYDYGWVVCLGGENEVTQSTAEMDSNVFGIISTNPGLMLNAGAGEDNTHPYIALAGRVPCRVIGKVTKGDRLVTSEIDGHARAATNSEDFHYVHVIGRALETKINDEAGLIEVVVGAK